MRKIDQIKLSVLILFVAGTLCFLFTDNFISTRAFAYKEGPPAGKTGAPSELTCDECHIPDTMGSGQFTIMAPQTYVPGQTYQITVKHVNSDSSRKRWGFELTVLGASNLKVGELSSTDAFTQVITGGPDEKNPRQYIEHTQAGTFLNQANGATWTFNWTAPSADVGPVTFYAAGNQANGNDNTSGDIIYSTFVSAIAASTPADISLAASPSPQTIAPGSTANFNLTTTPSGNFAGDVALSISGLPSEATATFSPATISFSNPFPINSTFRVTTSTTIPPGTYPLTITGTAQSVQRSIIVPLIITGTPAVDVAITKTGSPNPAQVGANLAYRIVVTNNGPSPANNVTVTDLLSTNATLVTATPGQGACSGTTTITCALGNLPRNASTTIALTVKPIAAGPVGSTATVTSTEVDSKPGNNSATASINAEAISATPIMTDQNLAVRTVVNGLDSPTSMAFIGANDFFVLEKTSGKVKRVVNGQVQSTVLDLAVNSASERGLLGIALHPNFATNKYVYLYWTESTTTADSANLDEVPTLGNRVDRYVWNGTALVFDRNLIKLRSYQADAGQPLRGNHNGGVLRFGPDGKIYIVIGDNGRRGFLQNLLTGVPTPDDQFGGPQADNSHLTGVILRLNDDGTSPTDNPFYATGATTGGEVGANLQRVFAYGVRNSFGMAFDPQTGWLWTQENGDDAFDEINRVDAGFNGGWTQIMGPSSRIAEFKQIETSRPGGLQQIRWSASAIADTAAEALSRLYMLPGAHYTEPEFSWRYAVALSPIGFVAGKALGPQFEGDLFVGEGRTTLYNGYLFRLKFSADRRSIYSSDPRLADKVADNNDKFDIGESESLLIGKNFGITTDIQTGPNGNLYVVSLSNSAVYEIYSNAKLYVANLNGGQEVPATNSNATGTATLLLSQDETTAKVSLKFSGLQGTQTGAHIHGAAAVGVNAGILFQLPDGQFNDVVINLTPAQVQDLKAGLFYVNVHSSTATNGEIRGQFFAAAQSNITQFENANYNVGESDGNAQIAVTRMGDTSAAATVSFTTSDTSNPADNCGAVKGLASSRCDYAASVGTINFAAGETRKIITVPIIDDGYVEGAEVFNLKLTASTGTDINAPATTTIKILDNDSVPAVVNPIKDPSFFVRQNYMDFLGREPDAPGLTFWSNEISGCGSDAACVDRKRVNTSGAFFLSTEFQSTGYFVYRLYKGALNRRPTYAEFFPDIKQVASGIVINNQLSASVIESNKTAFANSFVARSDFRAIYDQLGNQQYVDKLFQTTGVAVTDAEKAALVTGLNNNSETRASVLRKVADGTITQADGTQQFPNAYGKLFYDQEFNAAFVQMQYFGYLHRDPDQAGFDFWLAKLNQFKNFIDAEMVRSFIVSDEYRFRFGAQ